MDAPLISDLVGRDINTQVSKILRGLGEPDPPLDLRLVRDLLSLDRAFYTSTDDSGVRESVSRLVVAGKQVVRRPTLLIDAIKKLSLRALFLPDRRRILIDASQPKLKHRWNEAHEIGHSIIPWHQGLMGDDDLTLTRHCHEAIEAEANFAAGQLLFLGARFDEDACSLTRGFGAVDKLTTRFGNTKTSTLWRYVQAVGADVPIIAVISSHPHQLRGGVASDTKSPCKHVIPSRAFSQKFSNVSGRDLFRTIVRYCGAQRGGPLGEAEVMLEDDNGERHIFQFETFYNGYEALTLGVHLKKESLVYASG